MENLDFMTNNKSFTISISGKGFTIPKEYYSKLSNSIEADDYILFGSIIQS